MHAAGQFAGGGRAVEARDKELVGPEEPRTFAPDGNTDRPEQRRVEAFAFLEISNHEMKVVDESTAMKFVHAPWLSPADLRRLTFLTLVALS